MANRPVLKPCSVITNASMGGDVTSLVTIIPQLSMLSYQITWSAGATPIGDIILQVSNDYALDASGAVSNAGTWSDVILSDPTSVSGNSGKGFIDIDQIGAYAARIFYDRTSGSGTLNAKVMSKVA